MYLAEAIFSSASHKAAKELATNPPQLIVTQDAQTYQILLKRNLSVVRAKPFKLPAVALGANDWQPIEAYAVTENDLLRRLELIQQHVIQENENRQSSLLVAALNELHFVIRAAQGQPVFAKRPSDKDFEPRSGVETTGAYGGRCIR